MKFQAIVAVATAGVASFFGVASAQNTAVPITGAVNTGIQERNPLQSLATNNPDVFNMFLVALYTMQRMDENQQMSYYQIAGIHGVPFIPWGEPTSPSQDTNRGYCTHNSALFATWHRPYLALIEQRLNAVAINEAAKFRGGEAERWQKAAREVRLPYWDWAAQDLQSREPPQLQWREVTITRPGTNGEAVRSTIPNPLYQYRFTSTTLRNRYFNNQFRGTSATNRQPSSASISDSRNNLVDSQMNAGYSARRQNTFNLFSVPSFREFSNTQYSSSNQPNGWTSVESLHNEIHMAIGGNYGHMSSVPYSAFDPIFWLHHCNVDRLIAMYQALHPGRNVEPQQASGTFARRVTQGMMDNLDTPLPPFRTTSGNYYTSRDLADVSSIWNLGYAYPEVPVRFGGNRAQLPSFVASKVNELYRPTSNTNRRRSTGDSKRREWICHMKFDASTLGGSAEVQVYMAKTSPSAPSDANLTLPSPIGPTAGHTAGTAVGTGNLPVPTAPPLYSNQTVGTVLNGSVASNVSDTFKYGDYIGSGASFMDSSMNSSVPMDITATVPLTDALLAHGCPSLEPKDVVPFLKKNLKWVVKVGGQKIIPLSQIPSLKVGVSSSEVIYPQNISALPTWGNFETHYDVTEKKVCGITLKDKGIVKSTPAKPVPSKEDDKPMPSGGDDSEGGTYPKSGDTSSVNGKCPPANPNDSPKAPTGQDYPVPKDGGKDVNPVPVVTVAPSPSVTNTPSYGSDTPSYGSQSVEVKGTMTTIHVTVTTTQCDCKATAAPTLKSDYY